MRFFASIVGALALVTSAVAQSADISITEYPQSVTAGQTYTIKYTATDLNKPCSLILRRGNPDDLSTVATITTNAVGGSYQWKADSNLVAGKDYAFQIQQGNQINYSGQFTIKSTAVDTTLGSNLTPRPTPTSMSSLFNNSTVPVLTPVTPLTPYNASGTPPLRTPGSNSTVRTPVTPTSGSGAAATGNHAATGTGSAPTSGAVSMATSSFGLVFGLFAAMAFLQ